MRSIRTSLGILSLVVVASAFGQEPAATFTGKLEPQLAFERFHTYQRLWSAAADISKLHFSPATEKDAVVSVGALIDTRTESGRSPALLVEPRSGAPYIWIDTNGNGIYEAAEKFEMKAASETPDDFVATLHLPIKNAYFSNFPIFIQYARGFQDPQLHPTDRLMIQTAYAVALGNVDVNGQNVLFQYPFEPSLPAISTTDGVFGIDLNGDGEIRFEQFSPETSYAANDEVVLPLGDIFVSTSSIDMTTGRIVVRQRRKDEYKRIDLEIGKEMPDFGFTDADGKPRRLADFRGKYLLVDFWGVWCGDCTRETPFQIAAHDKFKKRGFEILGLDSDEKIDVLKNYLAKNKITWPQATHDSIKQLTEVSYRIQEFPSAILLGPDGKVLVLDQHELEGDELLDTLDRLLPR